MRLAFGGSDERLRGVPPVIREDIPPGTAVVLRGSSITGMRWRDGAPFDADGPGTSDLDLTLVGDDVIGLFTVTGFFVPGVHSRPLSADDPDIAPDLIPLRETLMAMTGRPVNIQASRDIVIQFRGDLLDQPYLVLIVACGHPGVNLKLLSYNIKHGGRGREGPMRRVIRDAAPDLVVLQEATRPTVIEQLAHEHRHGAVGDALRGESLGFMSRQPVAARRLAPATRLAPCVHRDRAGRLRVARVRRPSQRRARGLDRAPAGLRTARAARRDRRGTSTARTRWSATSTRSRPANCSTSASCRRGLRALVWLSGGRIRWRTIQTVLDAGYRRRLPPPASRSRRQHVSRPGTRTSASTTSSCRRAHRPAHGCRVLDGATCSQGPIICRSPPRSMPEPPLSPKTARA